MATIEQIPKTYVEATCVLARWHGEGGLQVYKMGRSEEFPFRSAVAMVLPKYWELIQSGVVLLPPGWDAHDTRSLAR
jgi:hypothetical protein